LFKLQLKMSGVFFLRHTVDQGFQKLEHKQDGYTHTHTHTQTWPKHYQPYSRAVIKKYDRNRIEVFEHGAGEEYLKYHQDNTNALISLSVILFLTLTKRDENSNHPRLHTVLDKLQPLHFETQAQTVTSMFEITSISWLLLHHIYRTIL